MAEITSAGVVRGPLWEEWARDPRWSEGVDVEALEVVTDVTSVALQLGAIDIAEQVWNTMPRLRDFVPLWWEVLKRMPGGVTLAIVHLGDVALRARSDLGPLPDEWAFAAVGHEGKIGPLDIDDVPPASAMWGRLVAARAHDDVDTFRALVEAVPDDPPEWMVLLGTGASSTAMEAYRRHVYPRPAGDDPQG